jgi:hypothetical protein
MLGQEHSIRSTAGWAIVSPRHLAVVGFQRGRGAQSVQATVTTRDDRGIGFFASQGWRQRVRVYNRSLLPEKKPKGRRNVVRGWVKRLNNNSID